MRGDGIDWVQLGYDAYWGDSVRVTSFPTEYAETLYYIGWAEAAYDAAEADEDYDHDYRV